MTEGGVKDFLLNSLFHWMTVHDCFHISNFHDFFLFSFFLFFLFWVRCFACICNVYLGESFGF
jgi:hypothetical protein